MLFRSLDNPTMPIIAKNGGKSNDTYVDQLVASARAAVDELVRRGVADPKRVAVGGHSYGAFTTANLLAHTDLFRAGIARSGAYNRTLTPFGFQGEERNFWQAQATYVAMSPFTVANQVNRRAFGHCISSLRGNAIWLSDALPHVPCWAATHHDRLLPLRPAM